MDSDGDGYGDNSSEGATNPDHFPALIFAAVDDDRDVFRTNGRPSTTNSTAALASIWTWCLNAFGNSTTGLGEDAEGTKFRCLYGCPDTDGDGRANQDDAFPLEPTQTTDSDGDGFGDNIGGVDGDECYLVPGVAEGRPPCGRDRSRMSCSTTSTAMVRRRRPMPEHRCRAAVDAWAP